MNTDDTANDSSEARASDTIDSLDARHRETLATLDKLARLATRVHRTRDIDDNDRRLAREIVHHFTTSSRQHHVDDETLIFPALLATGEAETVQAVQRLQQDHAWLEVDWTALSPLLDAIACGQGCLDPETLLEGVDVFVALSHEHIALEDSLIYPQARSRLGAVARSATSRNKVSRRTTEAA